MGMNRSTYLSTCPPTLTPQHACRACLLYKLRSTQSRSHRIWLNLQHFDSPRAPHTCVQIIENDTVDSESYLSPQKRLLVMVAVKAKVSAMSPPGVASGSPVRYSEPVNWFQWISDYCDTVSSTVGIRQIDNAMPIEDKNVLIVDDICDTGKTLVKLSEYLIESGAKSVMTCCLLLKDTKLNIGYRPDFLGFQIPDEFIVGYAIDYNECFRDLSHICSINEKAKVTFSSHRDVELGKLPPPTP
ncbi:Hypoxanthine-guanine phosphoribosyltransferase [Taenia crassiceps]|uniref:Hypoxanthine-guanine phosphoribosyltransferase n=1 Tax=Taenia crassiceps TaxID=6207 RepID=A0ABR4QNW9_9CEST